MSAHLSFIISSWNWIRVFICRTFSAKEMFGTYVGPLLYIVFRKVRTPACQNPFSALVRMKVGLRKYYPCHAGHIGFVGISGITLTYSVHTVTRSAFSHF